MHDSLACLHVVSRLTSLIFLVICASCSVQTEADFAPAARAGAHAHEIDEAPDGDEAPAGDRGPCYARSSGKITGVLPTLTDY